jgi:hypothetical protein
MGDRPRSSSCSGLRLLLRLVSVLAALCVLCVSGRASAVTAPVPMCGERNESIAAPPIFRAHDAGSISASPCRSDGLEVGKSAPFSPERQVVPERSERVLGFGALRLTESASSRLPIVNAALGFARPSHTSALFRPPRA